MADDVEVGSGFDWLRLPYEIKWASDRKWVAEGLFEPPLAMDRDGDEFVVTHPGSGAEVCRFPVGLVAAHDLGLVMERVRALPVDVADQAVAAEAAGRLMVDAPPDGDFVFVFLDGKPLLAVHRQACVPGWPAGPSRDR